MWQDAQLVRTDTRWKAKDAAALVAAEEPALQLISAATAVVMVIATEA